MDRYLRMIFGSDEGSSNKERVISRPGKTIKDRKNGNPERAEHNRQARAEYTRSCSHGSLYNQHNASIAWAAFPWSTCNGKKTRKLRAA